MHFSQDLSKAKVGEHFLQLLTRSMKTIEKPLYSIMKKNASLLWTESFHKSISKRLVYKWYFCVYPCSPFQPPYIPVKWGLPLDPVSNQPTGWLLLFCNNILISSDCCFDEGLLLLLLIYWSTELTPTWVIKYSWKQGSGPPALLLFLCPSLSFSHVFFFLCSVFLFVF